MIMCSCPITNNSLLSVPLLLILYYLLFQYQYKGQTVNGKLLRKSSSNKSVWIVTPTDHFRKKMVKGRDGTDNGAAAMKMVRQQKWSKEGASLADAKLGR